MMKKHNRILLTTSALIFAMAASLIYGIGTNNWRLGLIEKVSSARTLGGRSADLVNLPVMGETNWAVLNRYVEPERIRPRGMLMGALEEVQRILPELVVAPSPGEDVDNPGSIIVTIGQHSRRFDVDKVNSVPAVRLALQSIFSFILPRLGESDVEPERIQWGAINGMLSTLDPHSIHLDPDSFNEMRVSTHGRFGGLGIQISIRNGDLTIISPIEDTPASRAGLKPGDRIVRINDESTVNMPLTDAVSRMRGEVGTSVDIYVLRTGWAEPRKYTLERAEIRIRNIDSSLLDDGIGYVRIRSFQSDTTSELVKHINRLKQEASSGNAGEFGGLILDLRNNPGGLLEQAFQVANTFVNSGSVYSIVSQASKRPLERAATRPGTHNDFPLVVLVNPGSASGSEIVAGAVQNLNRGVVIGQTTFGKGSVQELHPLEDSSALKLTVSKYLTPGGISIQSYGITPDIYTVPMLVTRKRVNLTYQGDSIREADLDAHLVGDENRVTPESSFYTFNYYLDPEKVDPADDEDGEDDESSIERQAAQYSSEVEEDTQTDLAKGILRSGKQDRREMLKAAVPFLEERSQQEEEQLKAALSNLGVDWQEGPVPEDLRLQVALLSDNRENQVHAGGEIILKGRVTNNGSQPVHRLRGITLSPNRILNNREMVFGRLDPGEERTWEVKVRIPAEERSRLDPVSLRLSSGIGDEVLASDTALVHIREKARPAFAFNYEVDDASGGNGDGVLQPGEEVSLQVVLHNLGEGSAEEAVVSLSSQSGRKVDLRQGRHTINDMAPGSSHRAQLSFQVAEDVKPGEELEFQLTAYDARLRVWIEEKIKLVVAEPTPVDKEKSIIRLTADQVPVRSCAHQSCPELNRLSQGTILRARKATPQYYRIELQPELDLSAGWVERQHAERVGAEGEGSSGDAALLPGLQHDILFRPPTASVAIGAPEHHISLDGSWRLQGKIQDDRRVKDYWVYVHTRDGRQTISRKIAYVPNPEDSSEPGLMEIDLPISLRSGVNRIYLHMRDDQNLESTTQVIVYQPDEETRPVLETILKGGGRSTRTGRKGKRTGIGNPSLTDGAAAGTQELSP